MGKKFSILIVIVVVGIILVNYQKIFKTIIPPRPVIVSESADGSSSNLFNYSMKVIAEIRNDGGDGYVVFEATAYQNEESWTKTQSIYMLAKATQKVEMTFDEVKLLKKNPRYSVTAYAQSF